jgi:2-polyprenyl-3-methyl-5-hydroxy-6-metoxy-1,4-benzoquinol methylase
MRILIFFLAFLTLGQINGAAPAYASKEWWNQFWETSPGWGEPNARVVSLLDSLDGSKETITLIDIGAGNGRNSVFALMKLFEGRSPKSRFVVHCVDLSEDALRRLNQIPLPAWLQIATENIDANSLAADSLPKADLVLLYGILEYIQEENLSRVFHTAAQILHPGGHLVVVTLVNGPQALEIAGETTRPANVYTQILKEIDEMTFLDNPTFGRRPDRHDLGKGYEEDHLHYVYRTVLVKNPS